MPVLCKCKQCNTEFYRQPSKSTNAKFCSKNCQTELTSKNKIKCTCKQCGLNYLLKNSRAKKTTFCSILCKAKYQSENITVVPPKKIKKIIGPYTKLNEAKKCGHLTKKGRVYCHKCKSEEHGKIDKSCIICNSVFTVYKSALHKKSTCSDECSRKLKSERQKGEKSHRWQGGLTNENMLLRKGLDYKSWRESVFKRDNYTCQSCGQYGGHLTADHIKEWCLYPLLRFDINNGRTLCRTCHQKTENFSYKAYQNLKNNNFQLEMF